MAFQVKAHEASVVESSSSSSASLARDRVEESRTSTPLGKTSSVVLQDEVVDRDFADFQMHKRFRLEMVSKFGSMSSALYEFGADRETGRITQQQFVDVCCFRLGILTERDANDLFWHFANVDNAAAGFATYRDFNISDEEWKFLVRSKKDEGAAMPFSSTPSGSSAGKFHRPMGIHTAGEQPLNAAPRMSFMDSGRASFRSVTTTPRSQGAITGSSKIFGTSIMESTPGSRPRRRVYPWQLPQKPWIGSVFAGQGILEECSKTKFRPYRFAEQTFKTSGKVTDPIGLPMHQVTHDRKGDVGFLAATSPPRRKEMEPTVCETQTSDWWPWQSATPRPKLKSKLPRKAVKDV
eukprot:TRINITY_DN4571_c0_g2_i1.p1 TRINITY_DN4571_c0_g2~~TRINITY_DN4571_c0_g2_i1.p1  ORF type:complete len:351 (+),score=53.48 TRINITY_DN4571_c0_g2_i1:46-1098(+)